MARRLPLPCHAGGRGGGALSGWGVDVDIQELKDRMDGMDIGVEGSECVRYLLYSTTYSISPGLD
jgi:hypothetical protein